MKVYAVVYELDDGGLAVLAVYASEPKAEEHLALIREAQEWGNTVEEFEVLDEIDAGERAKLEQSRTAREIAIADANERDAAARADQRRIAQAQKELHAFQRLRQLEYREWILAARAEREAKA